MFPRIGPKRHLTAPAEWQVKQSSTGLLHELSGYASVFDVVDAHGDVVMPGAFKASIAERVPAGQVKLLDSHIADGAHVLGTVVEAREDNHGLHIRAALSAEPSVQAIARKAAEGHLNALSIGYSTVRESWHRLDGGKQVRRLEEVVWFEASVVPFPANDRALVGSVKNAQPRASGVALTEQLAEEEEALAGMLNDPRYRRLDTVEAVAVAHKRLEAQLDDLEADLRGMRDGAKVRERAWYRVQAERQLADARRLGDAQAAFEAKELLAWLDRQAEVAREQRRAT